MAGLIYQLIRKISLFKFSLKKKLWIPQKSCQKRAADEDVIQLKPSDCVNNTEWLEQNRTCGCLWGWTGTKCDVWGKVALWFLFFTNFFQSATNATTRRWQNIDTKASWTRQAPAPSAKAGPPTTSRTDSQTRTISPSHLISGKMDIWASTTTAGEQYWRNKINKFVLRNPDSDPAGFWCYTRDSSEVLETHYCAGKLCVTRFSFKMFLKWSNVHSKGAAFSLSTRLQAAESLPLQSTSSSGQSFPASAEALSP